MKVIGNSQLSADPSTVWTALNDPAVLVGCIPGCQRLEALGEDTYAMTVAAGVGSIKGVYDGRVRLRDQQHPGSFRMRATGAGAAGTIDADVRVSLEQSAAGTSLTYEADATVGGMIGGVGQRMLVGVSKRMAAEFFGNVDAALTGPSESGAAEPTHTEGVPAVYTAPGPRLAPAGRSGFARGVAVGASAALAGALVGAWIARRTAR